MQILVTVASKHGATGAIGEIVASVLRSAGHEVTTVAPDTVETIEPYDAVILGSAVYAGRWMESARRFSERHHATLQTVPVWLFSSGPIGTPPAPTEESPDALRLARELSARDHRTFAGRIDPAALSWVERTITRMVKAPDGDFRDWDAIRSWADDIAAALTTEEVPA
ncbi:MAG: flavodoxin domain-containing protein [Chloroflexota bacterium]|jgi:menaquinone-dependent protoporphyrinogen oxidase|nr:flavodoxin domain-containing protein [Chloroflexota bacterium]